MIRTFLSILIPFVLLIILGGCHGGQEKAWEESMLAVESAIAADEFLSDKVDHLVLERRKFVFVYIKPQKARINFRNVTERVAILIQEKMFGHEGNKMKEFHVKGILFDNDVAGDELVVIKCVEEGISIEKDRTTMTM